MVHKDICPPDSRKAFQIFTPAIFVKEEILLQDKENKNTLFAFNSADNLYKKLRWFLLTV
jgi:hypothetical protein